MARCGLKYLCLIATLVMVASCSVYKYVPEGKYLLDNVDIRTDSGKVENQSQYKKLSYQSPNTRWLGAFRIPLRLYSLSGKTAQNPDSKSLFRNMGEEPVLFDSTLCENSIVNMQRALSNAGYLKARVDKEVKLYKKPKADVSYIIHPGPRYYVSEIYRDVPDDAIDSLLVSSDGRSQPYIEEGMWLDASVLDSERERIAALLQTRGYYDFSKDNVSFVADTVSGFSGTSLTMSIRPYRTDDAGNDVPYPVYHIDSVSYVLTENTDISDNLAKYSKLEDDGYSYYYIDNGTGKLRLKPKIIRNHSFLTRGRLYNTDMVSRTYSSLSNLSCVRYSNIRFSENSNEDGLDALVYIVPNKKYSFSAELEGTNTAGDLGVAALMSLTNRNIFGGGEQLQFVLRGAFEAINNLPGYSGNSYIEIGSEVNLDFPKLMLPFVKPEFQRRSQATSQLGIMLNSQRRPEFNKMVFTLSWSYLWRTRKHTHKIILPNINFLTVPWISEQFKQQYLDPISGQSSILRYNYEDMLLSSFEYRYYYSTADARVVRPLNLSLTLNAESSGNLLNLISRTTHASVNDQQQYKCFGVAFAQYAKADAALTLNWRIDKWNNLLFHTEYGIAYPYSNSTSVPFEKRFYSGGANGVRGWAVRELGPGTYRGENDAVNYIKQAGDIKLEASLEFRSHLFWKVNAALFADAGNIWTIHEYDEQPGGVFKFNQFYRQLGVSCGAGIRLDFSFLVVRVDYGKQIFNPAYNESTPGHIPFVNKVDYRDYALHFAIGYPF